MKDKIKIIQSKLKTDNTRVSFYVPNREVFLKIEKVLIDHGYFWRGQQVNSCLDPTYDSYTRNSLELFINFDENEPKNLSLSSDPRDFIIKSDIILTQDNIDDFVKKIFLVEPDYSPKKINRSF